MVMGIVVFNSFVRLSGFFYVESLVVAGFIGFFG